MEAMGSSGSITSPDPEIRKVCPWSATTNRASKLRSILSVRQSLASSTAERFKLPAYCSSLVSKRAKSEKASAVEPANPARSFLVEAANFFRRVLQHVSPGSPGHRRPSPPRRYDDADHVVERIRSRLGICAVVELGLDAK